MSEPIQRWEYQYVILCVGTRDEWLTWWDDWLSELNRYGRDGWQLLHARELGWGAAPLKDGQSPLLGDRCLAVLGRPVPQGGVVE